MRIASHRAPIGLYSAVMIMNQDVKSLGTSILWRTLTHVSLRFFIDTVVILTVLFEL